MKADVLNKYNCYFEEFASATFRIRSDTSPGIAQNVLQTNAAVQNVNIIITQDPASFADSYALIKVLNSSYKVNRFSIIL